MKTTRPIVYSQDVIEVAPGIALEKRHGGRMSLWILRTTAPSSLDKWFEHLTTTGKNQRPDKPTFTMIDVATSRVTVTPYMRRKMNQLGDEVGKNMSGRTAYVLQRSMLSMVVRLFVVYDTSERFPNTEFQIFYDHIEAIEWLETGVQAAKTSGKSNEPLRSDNSGNPAEKPTTGQ